MSWNDCCPHFWVWTAKMEGAPQTFPVPPTKPAKVSLDSAYWYLFCTCC